MLEIAAGRREANITERLRQIGPRWQRDIRAAGDETKALYLPLLRSGPRSGVQIVRDIPYGTQARQVLDIYRPAGVTNAPVVVFVHGGAFVRGDKDTNDHMYANVLLWFAQRGCLGINVEYRLAPASRYPGGSIDVGLACQWLQQHAPAYGGNPMQVCLIGHSAGGTHVASLLCDPNPELAALSHGVSCAVLISARLRADVLPINPNADGVRAYYGDNPADHDAAAPIAHARRMVIPLLVVNAQYENPLLDLYSLEFALAVARSRGVAPLHTTLADHNHVSIMAHFNSGEHALGDQVLEFFYNACH